MNIIRYTDKSKIKKITIDCDTVIYYTDTNADLDVVINKDVKLFEYISNSVVNNNYNIDCDLVFDRFAINSSIKTKLNLNKSDICVDYFFSCINKNSNVYEIDINHNKSNTKSNIVNHGINLEDDKLDFIINSIIKNAASKASCMQDSKIIINKDNNCKIEPNLIVDNYDIEANHAAYIGTFDKEKIFYLQSRGISKSAAIKLLAKAFLLSNREVSVEIKNDIIKQIEKFWR